MAKKQSLGPFDDSRFHLPREWQQSHPHVERVIVADGKDVDVFVACAVEHQVHATRRVEVGMFDVDHGAAFAKDSCRDGRDVVVDAEDEAVWFQHTEHRFREDDGIGDMI